MTVFFRADGNNEIGLGHLTRTLALTEMLKDEFTTTFITKEKSKPFLGRDSQQIFENLIVIPKEIEIEDEPQFLAQFFNEACIVVLDGYHFSEAYQKELLRQKIKLVCVDDLHEIKFYADVIINHSVGINSHEYRSVYYTNFLLGGSYALLRAPFREKSIVDRDFTGNISAFVCFGGADPYNFTRNAIQRILRENKINRINIVVGIAYQHIESLEAEIAAIGDNKIRLFVNVSALKMKELMIQSQVAVCSASSVALEYMSVGGALFILQTADNQKDVFKNLLRFNLAMDWTDFNVESDFNEMMEKQAEIFDGNIRSRYLKSFRMLADEASLNFRRATFSDMHQYYNWANDEATRNNSFTTTTITLDDHKKWFSVKVSDKNSILYIFFLNNAAVGQVRFDINDGRAIISFSTDASFRGKGIGRMILKTAIEALHLDRGLENFVGYVKISNIQSMKIFESLRFSKQETNKYLDSVMYVLKREL